MIVTHHIKQEQRALEAVKALDIELDKKTEYFLGILVPKNTGLD
ncbi:MAG: hypothetical protein QNJ54_30595 [Prochloraceae cyanobacterium]|nr:hypothetical protein [Prochloraceae cyanobacterium]